MQKLVVMILTKFPFFLQKIKKFVFHCETLMPFYAVVLTVIFVSMNHFYLRQASGGNLCPELG